MLYAYYICNINLLNLGLSSVHLAKKILSTYFTI